MSAAHQNKVIGFENNIQKTCEHCGWPIPRHEKPDVEPAMNGRSRPGKYKIIM